MRPFGFIFLPAVAYQVLAVAAAIRQTVRTNREKRSDRSSQPGVSVLKPLRGLDPNTYEAFLSQAAQDYPEFELLFGVADENDPAVPYVRRLQVAFSPERIRLVVGTQPAANGKVGVLANLARFAKYEIWVVNDSDIKVTPEYLRSVVAPLRDETVGLVTCLYRAKAHTAAAAWEALGIATDFMPSTLVAQILGVREFGLGSTLVFRSADLAQAGGFEALAGFIADDYQLAKRITQRGKRAQLSTYVVETSLGDSDWPGIWQHQLRWARTIRASKGVAYAGLPISQAGLWIAIAACTGTWWAVLLLYSLRLASALLTGVVILRSSAARKFFWLAPLWDLYSFAVWMASYTGRSVRWRNSVLQISRDGRIE